MRYTVAIAATAALALACDPGPAPPTGTYAMTLSGTRTYTTFEGAAEIEETVAADSTLALYVDEGPNGRDLDVTFAALGLPPPSEGRLFELRIFPSTLEVDTGTTTLGGTFIDDEVTAAGQAIAGGSNVLVQFPDLDEPTLCAAYELYRYNLLLGNWSDDQWEVSYQAHYEQTCVLSDGTVFRDGYPKDEYILTGTVTPVYDAFPEAQAREVAP